MSENNNNQQTADNANLADAGNTNTKKKSKLRRFGGYALKGTVVAAIGAGIYFGARALMGGAGETAVDAIGDAAASVA